MKKTGLFLMLDADDSYLSDAFETLIAFMEKNDLDIAVGGYTAIEEEKGIIYNVETGEDVIYNKNDYAFNFPAYYNKIRTVWGKLVSFNVLKKCDFSISKSLIYGADTAFVLEALKNSNRFGIMTELVYNYYISSTSISYQFKPERMEDGENLFEIAYNFLSFFGEISNFNRIFLLMVYLNMLKSSIQLMNYSNCDAESKLLYLKKVIENPLTEEAFLIKEIPNSEKFDFIKTMII
jgi:GT2 family glycosyltransferase